MKNLLKSVIAALVLAVSVNVSAGQGPVVEEKSDPTIIVSTLAGYLTGSVITTIILLNPAAAPAITTVALIVTVGLYACYFVICDKIIEWMADREIEEARVSLLK